MSFYLVILLPALVCLFWSLYYLLDRLAGYTSQSQGSTALTRRAMTAFFCATTVLYACHCLYFAGIRSAVFETMYATANLCVYPLFYLYLVRLTGKAQDETDSQLKWHRLRLFLPALVVLVAYVVCFLTGAEQVRHWVYIVARVTFALQVVYVWISGSRLLQQYRYRLDNFYSDDRSYALMPLYVLLQLFGAIALLSMVLNVLGREWFAGKMIVAVPSLIMSALLYGLGYVASKIALPAVPFLEKRIITEEASSSSVQTTLAERLEQLMHTQKPYLNPNLTVNDLAQMLQTNRTYLSHALHDELGVSFSGYVNRFRIEHAKQILRDEHFETSKEAILTAQVESGFASESSFYRLFKQHTGKSPLAFRQEKD